MSTPCPYCGSDNPDTCLECRTCQRHLPARTIQTSGSRFSLATGIRVLVFLTALAALILILLTPDVSGKVDESADVNRFYRELVAMEHAVRKQKEYYWTIPEEQVNAYLAEVVKKHQGSMDKSWRRLVLSRVDFLHDSLLLTLHYQWGPITLSQQLKLARPVQETSSPSWKIQSFHLGKLPIPGVLRSRAADVLLNAFGAFERDLFVLRFVSEIHLDDEKAYLVNRRKPV